MRQGRVILLVAVGVALAASTAIRVHHWSDERTLWAEAIAQSPANPRPWANLGRLYVLDGYPGAATIAYQEAIRAASQPSRSRYDQVAARAYAEADLALVQLDLGHRNDALVLASAAAALFPTDVGIQRISAWINATE